MINTADFENYLQEGETEISQETPFLLERTNLTIQVGVSDYTLPDCAFKINRVTWLGVMLFPLDEKIHQDIWQGIALSTNTPVYYSDNLMTSKTIRFHSTPSINLSNSGDPWLRSTIMNSAIVEYYRTADSNNTLPNYLRSRVMRHYIGMRSYLREGSGQNLKASSYHRSRWSLEKAKFKNLLWSIRNTTKRLSFTNIQNPSKYPFQPILPIDRFGTPVDE